MSRRTPECWEAGVSIILPAGSAAPAGSWPCTAPSAASAGAWCSPSYPRRSRRCGERNRDDVKMWIKQLMTSGLESRLFSSFLRTLQVISGLITMHYYVKRVVQVLNSDRLGQFRDSGLANQISYSMYALTHVYSLLHCLANCTMWQRNSLYSTTINNSCNCFLNIAILSICFLSMLFKRYYFYILILLLHQDMLHTN